MMVVSLLCVLSNHSNEIGDAPVGCSSRVHINVAGGKPTVSRGVQTYGVLKSCGVGHRHAVTGLQFLALRAVRHARIKGVSYS